MTLTFRHITDSQTTHYKSKGSQSRSCCSRLPFGQQAIKFTDVCIFPKSDPSGAVNGGECGGKVRRIREWRFRYSDTAAGRWWWVVAFAQIVATVYNRWTRNAPTPPPTAWKFISASQFLLQPRGPPNCHCKVFIEHASLNHLGVPTNPRSFNPSLWDGSANQHGGSLIGSMQVSSQHPPEGPRPPRRNYY